MPCVLAVSYAAAHKALVQPAVSIGPHGMVVHAQSAYPAVGVGRTGWRNRKAQAVLPVAVGNHLYAPARNVAHISVKKDVFALGRLVGDKAHPVVGVLDFNRRARAKPLCEIFIARDGLIGR